MKPTELVRVKDVMKTHFDLIDGIVPQLDLVGDHEL